MCTYTHVAVLLNTIKKMGKHLAEERREERKKYQQKDFFFCFDLAYLKWCTSMKIRSSSLEPHTSKSTDKRTGNPHMNERFVSMPKVKGRNGKKYTNKLSCKSSTFYALSIQL